MFAIQWLSGSSQLIQLIRDFLLSGITWYEQKSVFRQFDNSVESKVIMLGYQS